MDDTNLSATSEELDQTSSVEQSVEQAAAPAPAQEAQAEQKEDTRSQREIIADALKKQMEGNGQKFDTPSTPDAKAASPERVKAPQSWSPAVRERFAQLEPDIQAEIIRREKEINVKLQETAQERKVAQDFIHAINPYVDVIKESGQHPVQFTQSLYQTARVLTKGTQQEKAELIAHLVKNAQVDWKVLDAAFEKTFENASPVAALPPELDQRLARIEQTAYSVAAERQQAYMQNIQAQIDQFAKDPKNEYFNDVVNDMIGLIQSGQAQDLPSAYEKAVWANPETRKALLAKQQQSAARAQAGGVSLNNKGPSTTSRGAKQFEGMSQRDTIAYLLKNGTERI